MGYSSFSSSFIVSLLLVFLLLINISTTRPSKKATDYIGQIFPKTQNLSLCLQTLAQSSSGDFKALSQIRINITQTNVNQTSNLIASLSKQAANPKVKGVLYTSAKNYEGAIDNHNVATHAMNSGDIRSMNARVSATKADLGTCEDEFEGTLIPRLVLATEALALKLLMSPEFIAYLVTLRRTVYISLCYVDCDLAESFKTLPQSSSGDLKALYQIAINITQTNVKQTSNLIASLSKQAADPKINGTLSMCAKNYEDAIGNLNVARQAMNSGDTRSMNARALAAVTDLGIRDPPNSSSQVSGSISASEALAFILLTSPELIACPATLRSSIAPS
ncbi:Pectinesterase inhibitor [Camellia lanceoleosa]|uniref:Pectinesterase inhibitor n=1 Tax=Camellia lanceoleosa TaxID=1840588 RepID=A0ACC0FYN7_9ERIC|nr:Pectinesterase inhibitor [Camellia lanceoleosa]